MMPDKKAVKTSANSAVLAEQILQGMITGGKKPTSSPSFSKPRTSFDIKNVEVPESMMESIIGFATDTEEEVEEVINEEVVIENKISNLIKRLSSLLEEAKELVNEVTGSGGGFVHQGKPKGNPKRGSFKTNKRS